MKPGHILFLIFVCIPILEIYVLIQVGSSIGGLNTILLVIITAIIGTHLLKTQGSRTAKRVQQSMSQGQLPALEILEGLVILIAGVLLLTPGFFTDILGLVSLIPQFRQTLLVSAMKQFFTSVTPANSHKERAPSKIIEGECHRED